MHCRTNCVPGIAVRSDNYPQAGSQARSGPDGAAILQTKDGFEVADCGGLSDTIVYPDVPKDLSARPTLSWV